MKPVKGKKRKITQTKVNFAATESTDVIDASAETQTSTSKECAPSPDRPRTKLHTKSTDVKKLEIHHSSNSAEEGPKFSQKVLLFYNSTNPYERRVWIKLNL